MSWTAWVCRCVGRYSYGKSAIHCKYCHTQGMFEECERALTTGESEMYKQFIKFHGQEAMRAHYDFWAEKVRGLR